MGYNIVYGFVYHFYWWNILVFFHVRKPNKHQHNQHQRKGDYVISINAKTMDISHGIT